MNIAIFGAKGRVGKMLVRIASAHNVWQIDKDWKQNPLKKVDVAIDFSLPSATNKVVEFCKEHRCPLVTGVTGRNADEQNQIEKLSQTVTVVAKDNFCQGIELLEQICLFVAQNTNWQCEIVETHHAGKKDSPSGTAKHLAGVIAKAQGSFATVTTHSLRLGSNVGTHTVVFAQNGQSLTLTHQAENIEIFARGALDCAVKLVEKLKG